MKKLIIPLLAFAAMSSCKKTVVSPLEITKADFNTYFKAGGTSYNTFQAAVATLSVPVAGENQNWDFSTLAETSSSIGGGTNFLVPGNPAYPTATFAFASTSTYKAGANASPGFAATNFYEISDAGYYTLGFSQNAATAISITSLGATINYSAQNLTYTGTTKYPNILFPMKYGTAPNITSGIVFASNYTVNAPAFGLINTPGQTKLTSSVTIEIIGSGIANLKGIGQVRVLLTKNTWSDKANYFLGGAPAPAALLSNLGITDGGVTTGTTYRFIAEGLGSVGLIDVDANGIISASFRKG